MSKTVPLTAFCAKGSALWASFVVTCGAINGDLNLKMRDSFQLARTVFTAALMSSACPAAASITTGRTPEKRTSPSVGARSVRTAISDIARVNVLSLKV